MGFAALLAVVLWPKVSFASIVPACEADLVTAIVAARSSASPMAAADACETRGGAEAGDSGDDIDNSRAAPICDADGTSAIAPPRLHSVSDMRIVQQKPCDHDETVRASVQTGRGDPPARTAQAVVPRAVLPSPELPVYAASIRLIEPVFEQSGPRTGERREVYHPPR